MHFLSGVTIGCFFTSYLVALILELTRPLLRVPGRMAIVVIFTLTGLATQLIYLSISVRTNSTAGTGLLASWHEWSLLAAWCLALCYLVLVLQRPEATVGYFILPPVLVLVVVGWLLRSADPFSPRDAANFWLQAHGISMMLGTVAITLGLIIGVMYLVHEWRLKRKRLGKPGLRLPPLDSLQRAGRICLAVGTLGIAAGLCAGVIANLNRSGQVGWTERGVLLSGLLFAWLVGTSALELLYAPARQGKKVAYLSFAHFGFLILALLSVLASSHGTKTESPQRSLMNSPESAP